MLVQLLCWSWIFSSKFYMKRKHFYIIFFLHPIQSTVLEPSAPQKSDRTEVFRPHLKSNCTRVFNLRRLCWSLGLLKLEAHSLKHALILSLLICSWFIIPDIEVSFHLLWWVLQPFLRFYHTHGSLSLWLIFKFKTCLTFHRTFKYLCIFPGTVLPIIPNFQNFTNDIGREYDTSQNIETSISLFWEGIEGKSQAKV